MGDAHEGAEAYLEALVNDEGHLQLVGGVVDVGDVVLVQSQASSVDVLQQGAEGFLRYAADRELRVQRSRLERCSNDACLYILTGHVDSPQ